MNKSSSKFKMSFNFAAYVCKFHTPVKTKTGDNSLSLFSSWLDNIFRMRQIDNGLCVAILICQIFL